MSDMLADHADVIDKVNQLMTKLRFTLPAAHREVTTLLTKLEDLNAITLALQSEDCSLLDARQIFDTVIEDYPDAAARLGRSTAIVKNPAFEDGVVKVLLGSKASLTSVEAEAIKALRDSQARQGSEEGAAVPALSLAERALKKKKVMRAPIVYKDCRFLRPTSNMCERFFSATKLAVGDRRCSITPKNFEEQMFLRANIHFWTTEDVQAMMRTLDTLGRNFSTLQSCCLEIIRVCGNNNFKIPHMHKSKRMAQGKLPDVLLCDRDVWADGCAKLGSVDFNCLMRTLQAEVSASLEMMELCNVMEALDVKDNDEDGHSLDVMEILQL
ncbi:hypothetical protein DYB38_013741 [Aphanomyces astaci]|uniref:HAT C-terminal dimerisation domain-containing protein n=1 Tax=Aphanomyces astaci TaxID=112090 RepID=A0A397DTU8_APHAT|nr:hypothetical protein DYB38_013741 [Aphanomyces astaci]